MDDVYYYEACLENGLLRKVDIEEVPCEYGMYISGPVS